jgi:hypothetical protein
MMPADGAAIATSADLQHYLAPGVPGRDPCQRLAGLIERQHRLDLRAEFAPIDQAGQLLKPRPAAGAGLLESGAVRVVIDKTYPLDCTAAAVAHMLGHHARGKVAITVP